MPDGGGEGPVWCEFKKRGRWSIFPDRAVYARHPVRIDIGQAIDAPLSPGPSSPRMICFKSPLLAYSGNETGGTIQYIRQHIQNQPQPPAESCQRDEDAHNVRVKGINGTGHKRKTEKSF